MPAFVRPPDPADPAAFEGLVSRWWGFCERWAARQERFHPCRDFGPAANVALWKAAATYDPRRGPCFLTHLRWELRSARGNVLRRRLDPLLGAAPILDDPEMPARLPEGEPDFEGRIACLGDRAREVVRLRFAGGLSQREAGERLGCTRWRVQEIEAGALSALRAR